jgi:hypothetical protein
VATPFNETLFVGLYEIQGLSTAATGLVDPITNQDVGGLNYYDLVQSAKLTEYRGRLIVAWGLGYRSWVQLAAKQDKPIIEVRRSVGEPLFPGFLDFREKIKSAWNSAVSLANRSVIRIWYLSLGPP